MTTPIAPLRLEIYNFGNLGFFTSLTNEFGVPLSFCNKLSSVLTYQLSKYPTNLHSFHMVSDTELSSSFFNAFNRPDSVVYLLHVWCYK